MFVRVSAGTLTFSSQPTMDDDPYYLRIQLDTRSRTDSITAETVQKAISPIFEELGGITRAIVHFEVIKITSVTSEDGRGLFHVDMKLHKKYVCQPVL